MADAPRRLSTAQQAQESEYSFPYHHLVDYADGSVALTRTWNWALPYLGRLHLIFTALDGLRFDSLADVGCGDGRLLSLAAGRYPARRFFGVDYSERAVSFAKTLCGDGGVTFSAVDITAEAIEDRFDVVTLVEVIEHIPPDGLDAFLAAATRLLRPGGTLLCTAPSTALTVPKKHYQHFTPETVRSILQAAGLAVHECAYIDRPTPVFRAAEALFRNRVYMVSSRRLQTLLFKLYCALCLHTRTEGRGVFAVAEKSEG